MEENEKLDEGAETEVESADMNEAAEPAAENEQGDPEAEAEDADPGDAEEGDEPDFEFDENGDVVIPEDRDEEEIEKEETSDAAPGGGEEPEAEPDERDAELLRLRGELEDLRSQTRDTLKKLGVTTDDVMDGLAQIAAESADMTAEDYKKQRAEERKAEIEAEAKRIADFEALAAKDLAELQEIYPETKAYNHVRDMPEEVLKKFARNRNLGLPAKEAYAAANIDGIRSGATATGKRQAMNDSKAHLLSSKPKANSSSALRIPAKEMDMWRGMFPGKSDKEIAALYRKTL